MNDPQYFHLQVPGLLEHRQTARRHEIFRDVVPRVGTAPVLRPTAIGVGCSRWLDVAREWQFQVHVFEVDSLAGSERLGLSSRSRMGPLRFIARLCRSEWNSWALCYVPYAWFSKFGVNYISFKLKSDCFIWSLGEDHAWWIIYWAIF